MSWSPLLQRAFDGTQLETITLGHPVVDEYLAFAGARDRLNSWLAVAFDLKVFFSVVTKEPAAVTTADVFAFIKAQRAPRVSPKVVRLEDGEAGAVGSDHQAAPGIRLGAVRLSGGPRRPRRHPQPGPAGHGDPTADRPIRSAGARR